MKGMIDVPVAIFIVALILTIYIGFSKVFEIKNLLTYSISLIELQELSMRDLAITLARSCLGTKLYNVSCLCQVGELIGWDIVDPNGVCKCKSIANVSTNLNETTSAIFFSIPPSARGEVSNFNIIHYGKSLACVYSSKPNITLDTGITLPLPYNENNTLSAKIYLEVW